jgi:hypothetical protein
LEDVDVLGKISCVKGWSSTMGVEGCEEDKRLDIHQELKNVGEL